MRLVNIHEAKSKLSKLVEEVLAGEEVIIAKAGKPVAKLVPYKPSPKPRQFGGYENEIKIPPDFDETDEEIVKLFKGKSEGLSSWYSGFSVAFLAPPGPL